MKYDITHALEKLHGTSNWVCWNSNYAGLEWNDSSKPKPTEESLNAKVAELDAAEPLRLLRIERDKRLAATDWRANGDLTLSDEWKTYRQALRDMTKQTPKLLTNHRLDLTSVTWPTEPS